MILVDTSAWIEYLRRTGSAANRALAQLVEERAPLATTDAIVMEILAGARSEQHAAQLRRLFQSFESRTTIGPIDFEQAAWIQRICRKGGDTVRSLIDCLIAAVALREGLPVLAHDKDFEVIARHTGLELVRL